MKEKIIEILQKYPNGLRLREMAAYLDYYNRMALLDKLEELKQAGLINNRSNDDHANGEYYFIWYLVK